MLEQPPPAAPRAPAAPGWRLVTAAALALAASWAVYVHFATAIVPFDDAYISFRYAENLAAGRGLVYNDGERVFGSSTPLFVLWLTALRLLVAGDLATVAVRTNAIAFVLAALLAGWLVRRTTGRPLVGAAAALAILVNPMLLSISIGGMETFWFLSLLIAALWVLGSDPPRPWRFGLLAGLVILTRAEGVLLLPLALVAWARQPRVLLRAAASAALPLAIWTIFSTLYFGSPVPQSMVAKAAPIYLLPGGFTFEQIVDNLDHWVTGDRFGALRSVRRGALAVVLAAATAATLLWPAARRRGAWFPAALLAGLVAIYAFANTLYFEWYWPPVSVMLLLALVIGTTALVSATQTSLIDRGRRRHARALGVVGAVLLAIWLGTMSLSPLRYGAISTRNPMEFVEQTPTRRRVLAYLAAGEALTRAAAPGDTVAAPELGALGATYRGRILDPCGLISREAMPFLPIPPDEQPRIGAGAISVAFVEATLPDWIVALPSFISPRFATSQWFRDNYRLEGTMPLPFVIWESREILIYRRRV